MATCLIWWQSYSIFQVSKIITLRYYFIVCMWIAAVHLHLSQLITVSITRNTSSFWYSRISGWSICICLSWHNYTGNSRLQDTIPVCVNNDSCTGICTFHDSLSASLHIIPIEEDFLPQNKRIIGGMVFWSD